ncbi:hypothetical protein B5F35_14610 [Anaeromassilibacillus sp. An200]|nr:hypothetical protein B5F35_14610 [Anaeromassilibacillus sp. An200]
MRFEDGSSPHGKIRFALFLALASVYFILIPLPYRSGDGKLCVLGTEAHRTEKFALLFFSLFSGFA